jgi:beta-galactosidase
MPLPDPAGRRSRYLRLGVALALVITLGVGLVAAGVWEQANGIVPAGATDTYTPPAVRQRLDLNGEWRFVRSNVVGAQAPGFRDAVWSTVTVPHTWNAIDGADGGNNYYRGVGWYRRHFTVAPGLAGKLFYLEFDGVNQVADVWVNGTYLGQHQGGYSRFRFSAAGSVRPGQDNVVAVRVNNAHNPGIAPLIADYTFEGGIYRSVSLWATDPLQVRLLDYAGPGVYLRQREVTALAATVDVTAKLANNGMSGRSVVVRTIVTDAAGTVVSDHLGPPRPLAPGQDLDVTQTVTIPNPRRWDGLTDPYQYRATVELRDSATRQLTDVVTEPLGLRTFAVHPDSGFSLNGRPLRLNGVNLHQDQPGVGWAATEALRGRDLELVKEIGANAVRMAHYQHDQRDYTLADEAGLVVWAEIPLVDYITDSPAFARTTEQQLRELIRQNYNHPSIVFWGIGNEQRVDDPPTNALLNRLAGIVDEEDPDRLSTYAHCCVGQMSPVSGHTETSGYNKYYGWYVGEYGNLGAWLDALHTAHPARKLALSEYGAGGNPSQHALNPTKPVTTGAFHPEEYQSLLHEESWRQIDARPYLWGSFVWNMFDFASDARSEGGVPGLNDKGLVTRDRALRKDAFFWYKANWSPAPTLYITSRRWVDRTVAATELKVYSNAATVKATVNGVPLADVSAPDHRFRWPAVTLRPGVNTIAVSAVIGGQTYTDTVTWVLTSEKVPGL